MDKSNLPCISRRTLVAGAAALTAGGLTGFDAKAQSLASLSDDAANAAKELASGRQITLRLLIPTGSRDNVDPLIAAFRERTGIDIDVAEIELSDINTYLILNTVGGGEPLDIALPASFGMPNLVDTGVLRPLTEYARKYEPPGLRDGILYRVADSFDSELYGFQADGDAYVMFYNADLLNNRDEQDRYAELTGTPLGIPNTWEELDRQLAFFHRPDDGLYGGALFRTSGYLAWEWWVRFHAKGLWPFSEDMTPQIASEQGIQALQEMIDATQYLVPEANTQTIFENWERFSHGDVYCNIGWGGTQKYLNSPGSKVRGKLAFGPTPGGYLGGEMIETPYFNWGWDYVVTQASSEPELAYLFCLFASSPDMSTRAVREPGGFFDPYRTEHYDDPVIREVYSDAFLEVHRDSLKSSIPDLYIASQIEYFTVLNDWLTAAFMEEVSPQDALYRTAQEWSLITIRAGKAKQQQRWLYLRSLYPAGTKRLLQDLPL